MVVSKKKNTLMKTRLVFFIFYVSFAHSTLTIMHSGTGGEGSHFQYIMDVHAMYLEKHTPTTEKKIQTNS